MAIKPSFKEVLAQRQEYLDVLRSKGDMYALGYLESSFLYHMGDNGLEPLNPFQLETLAKWKEESAQ